jgi:hypothetical protein
MNDEPCCGEFDESRLMVLYTRKPQTVRAVLTADNQNMLVEVLLPKDGSLSPTPTIGEHIADSLYLIPTVNFFEHYSLVGTESMSDSQTQVSDFLKAPFVGITFAEPDAEVAAMAAASPDNEAVFVPYENAISAGILDNIPLVISTYKDFITVEILLWGAQTAFDFAIGKIPFPVPQAVKTKLWDKIEAAIRSIWDAQNN